MAMLDAAPSLTPAQVGELLRYTTVDMDDPFIAGFQTGFDAATGFGLVNGVSAMNAARVSQGDYNGDGRVDGGDYVAWRNRLGTSGLAAFSSADGNGNTVVDVSDYSVWKSHYGDSFPAPGGGSGGLAIDLGTSSRDLTLSTTAGAPIAGLNGPFLDASAPDVRTQIAKMSVRVGDAATLDSAARQDAGLLAWLAERSTTWFDESNERSDSDRLHSITTDCHDQAIDTILDAIGSPLSPAFAGV